MAVYPIVNTKTGELAQTDEVPIKIIKPRFFDIEKAKLNYAITGRKGEELVADAKAEKSKIERAIKSIEAQISKDKSAGKSTTKLDKSLEVKRKKLSEVKDKIAKIKSREVRTLTI